ncbi:MAG: hypothetical protein II453_20915 [Alphaproteobacteria bacterium]|nr:hypothetical protein [Alphaproteobacteria bacterium]
MRRYKQGNLHCHHMTVEIFHGGKYKFCYDINPNVPNWDKLARDLQDDDYSSKFMQNKRLKICPCT